MPCLAAVSCSPQSSSRKQCGVPLPGSTSSKRTGPALSRAIMCVPEWRCSVEQLRKVLNRDLASMLAGMRVNAQGTRHLGPFEPAMV